MKKISLFGSTGSIGEQVLDVVSANSDLFEIVTLSCRKDTDKLLKQIESFHPKAVGVVDHRAAAKMAHLIPDQVKLFTGDLGLVEMLSEYQSDIVFNAVVGFAGLKVTVSSVKQGRVIALANKESLVAGGEMVINLIQSSATQLIPVDSEHSAIFQCLKGEDPAEIERIIITASGGPFRGYTTEQLRNVTLKETLAHPTWRMGKRVTVDSATLMNKGLEVIEARYLFGVDPKQIEVVIHPQSIIHSMVEFLDGSVLAHLGRTDMRIPIQYALSHPERLPSGLKSLDFAAVKELSFEKPDLTAFPCLGIALEALEEGGTMPCIMNAADEVAVGAFLDGVIGFHRIPEVISTVMGKIEPKKYEGFEELEEIDILARKYAEEMISKEKVL